jgi:hypothetical protein
LLLGSTLALSACAGTSRTPAQGGGAIAGQSGIGTGTTSSAGTLGGNYLVDQHEKAKQRGSQPASTGSPSKPPAPPWAGGQ